MQLQYYPCIKRIIDNLYFVINELFCNSRITLLCIAKEVFFKQIALNGSMHGAYMGPTHACIQLWLIMSGKVLGNGRCILLCFLVQLKDFSV